MASLDAQTVIPRGGLRRFMLSGGFNTAIFWLLWEIFRLFTGTSDTGETASWAIAWFLSSVIAHFVHRIFTFDGRRDVKYTIVAALSVYCLGLVGSTITFDSLLKASELPSRVLFLANMAVWGIANWLMMRWLVFGYSDAEN